MAVYFPLKLTLICSKNKTHIILVSLILFALVFYSFAFFTSGIETNRVESKCVTYETFFNVVRSMAMTDIVITTILPFMIITKINIMIAYKLNKNSNSKALDSNNTYKIKNYISNTLCRKDSANRRLEIIPLKPNKKTNKKSVKFNEVSLAVTYQRESNVSFLIRKSTHIKRTKVYSEATKTLFIISFVFLILHCPLALNKTLYFLNENLSIKKPSKALNNFEELFQIEVTNETIHPSSYSGLETSEFEEIFERVTCYIFYLNFSFNFFLYTYNKSKFRNIMLKLFQRNFVNRLMQKYI